MTKSYHPSKKKEEKPYPRFTWLLDAKQVITDIARKEADLDTLKAGASLIPVAKITKVPKVVKAIGNVGKTGFKKGKEGEKIAKSNQAKQTKAKNKGGRGAGESGLDASNPFYKPGGGSNLDDFMTPHAEKHAYNPDVKSTRNKTQFGENADVAKLRKDTLLYPDEVIYDSEHNMIKYVKEYDFNISTPDTPTGSHRVFINLDPKSGKTNRNSQFPYYGGNK